MQVDLTIFFLKTLPTRPKGLRVKLKIITVNSSLATFDDATHPAASIMRHGLYFAKPTHNSVKDPVLFAVLNQTKLKDQDLETEFSVVWTPEEKQLNQCERNRTPRDGKVQWAEGQTSALPTEKQHPKTSKNVHITLLRNGIAKILPTATFNQLLDVTNQRTSWMGLDAITFSSFIIPELKLPSPQLDLQEYCQIDEARPSLIIDSVDIGLLFIACLQSWLNSQRENVLPNMLKLKMDFNSRTVHRLPVQIDSKAFDRFMSTLNSQIDTLIYLLELQAPQNPSDLITYHEAIKCAQAQLKSLISLMLKLLIEPISQILANLADKNLVRSVGSEYAIQNPDLTILRKARSDLQTLLGYLQMEEQCTPFQLLLDQLHVICCDYSIGCSISGSLERSEVAGPFIERLEFLLADLPPPTEFYQNAVQSMNNHQLLKESSLRRLNFAHINNWDHRISDVLVGVLYDDKTCLIRSAKCTDSSSFGPKLSDLYYPTLKAVIAVQGTKIFIISEELSPDKQSQLAESAFRYGGSFPIIKVFRGDTETASFKLAPNHLINGYQPENSALEYFTGRYFVKARLSESSDHSLEIMLLDLQPCILPHPEPPTCSIIRAGEQQTRFCKDWGSIEDRCSTHIACTDKFLSCLRIEYQCYSELEMYVRSATMTIFKFSDLTEPQSSCTIHFTKRFQNLVNSVGGLSVFGECSTKSRLCWSKKYPKRVFYTQIGSSQFTRHQQTLLIACFEVTLQNRSSKTYCAGRFHMKQVMQDKLIDSRSQMHILSTRVREYLVVDMMTQSFSYLQSKKRFPSKRMRMLFTVHKKRIQPVQVNGELIQPMGLEFGHLVRNAGYETNFMSLHYYRRIFCSEKVLCALYRLDYKPT